MFGFRFSRHLGRAGALMSIEEVSTNGGWRPLAFGGHSTALEVPPDYLEKLPVAIYACDSAGRILWFNNRAAELWGRTPLIAEDAELFCGSYRRFCQGREISKEETPMAVVLRTGIAIQDVEGQVERPDGSRAWATFHIEPVKDENGRLIGAINCFHETTASHVNAEALAQRVEEQSALFEFTDRQQHAGSANELHELAIDALIRAMHCQRAAILMFDGTKVMRFVASRGLSDTYRQAVDGHSPWRADSSDAEPICINDIETAVLPESLKETVRSEGIGALTFIPLKEADALIGKFMAYHDTPHVFVDSEINAGLTIARQLAFALERQRAAEATQRLVTIVESSDDAIISKNLDGVIQTWNRGAQRIFGYTAEEVVGKHVTVLMPPERYDEEPGILARLRRGERIDHYQTVRRRKDGTLIDVSLTVSPVRDRAGRIIGASKIARDISDQKRAETALRDSEQRLQDLLAAIPAAIYTTDATGKITYYNEAAVEFAGRRPTIGSDEWCVTWKLYWPDGTPLPHNQCPMAVALKEGRPIRGKEAVAERPDGTRVPFIPFPTPIRDSSGKVVGAINMLVDVSERKEAESHQRMLMRELNHRVKNNMQMLQSVLFTATRQTQSHEARKVLEDASNRITAMAAAQRVLYDTNDATRFGAGKFLEAVCSTAQQIFPSNVRIVCEAASGQLENDAAMPLALILNELLTNAAKYGCRETGENAIRVGLTNGDGNFLLYVEDDGPGFDLNSVDKQSSGLKLVQLLARQLHGHLEVACQPRSRCSVRFS
jgi:PAS domain S-box-containing protein